MKANGRSLRDYLQPDKTIQLPYIIFSLNIWQFEIKSGVVQLLPKSIGWTSPVLTFLNSKKFVPLSTCRISAQHNYS